MSESHMNCIPALRTRRRRFCLLASALVFAACGAPASESPDKAPARAYRVHYEVGIEPVTSEAIVAVTITQSRGQLREMTFASNVNAISDVRGDGIVTVEDGVVAWRPGEDGGTLSWRVAINNARGADTYDAWLGRDWGVFRAEDIIPRARTRTLKGTHSRTTLDFRLPTGWSVVTEYRSGDGPILVDRPERRFDQPTGWIVTGHLGVRRETIAGVRVAIAAPEDQDVRRMDMLALLNWTLPELIAILPDALPRLTIVSAGHPMWRGGLSAPASFFIHSDRPLISENATSALLHEVMHTALSLQPGEGHDWIAEGLAEYYSVELLRRGKAISRSRHEKAIADQVEWAKQATTLCGGMSTGPNTAYAVTIFRRLNAELVERTDGKADLDELVRRLAAAAGEVDLERLSSLAASLGGEASDVLHIGNLPGCRSIGDDPEH